MRSLGGRRQSTCIGKRATKMKHDRAPLPSPQQSGPSDIVVFRWLAAVATIVTPVWAGYIAHYEFGLSRQEIRTPAVIGAAIVGLLMATEHFGQKLRKPRSNKGSDRSPVE